ncbi:MAG TPA: hypothetical protein VKX49_02480 [Bryobacteraceae bacterium]|nr:hypothetical protein [Bryobacteraceae bacterium]
MKKHVVSTLAMALFSCCAYAADGVVLINQSTVLAAGGFPYEISQPGSYRLSGNLVVVPAGVDGIKILANDVTFDLNGFSITGPVTCTGAGATLGCTGLVGSPVGILGGAQDVIVRNGSVVGFDTGVSMNGSGLVEEINARSNALVGIAVVNSVARRNNASRNGTGILAGASSVTENVANFNLLNGLQTSSGGVYGSNTFWGNGGAPVVNSSSSSVSQNNNACNSAGC